MRGSRDNGGSAFMIEPGTSAGHVLGGAAALGSAFLWALAAILFRRAGERVAAVAMNFVKGLVAIACLFVLVIPLGGFQADVRSVVLLSLSGLVGIALGDTLYFLALARLGARRILLLSALIPVATAMVAVGFLGERLPWGAWLGIALVLGAVSFVLWERAPDADGSRVRKGALLMALVFVGAETFGIVATKLGVAGVSAVEATLIRHLAATFALGLWLGVAGQMRAQLAPLRDRRLLGLVTGAGLLGGFLGMWLAVTGLKYTHAAVAATLNATSPLFVLPLAAWLDKEPVARGALVAAVVAVAGLGLHFFSVA